MPFAITARYRSLRSLCARLAALNFGKKDLSADDCQSSVRRQAGRMMNESRFFIMLLTSRGSQESAAALVSQVLFYNPSQIWNFGMYPMMKITTMSTGMP